MHFDILVACVVCPTAEGGGGSRMYSVSYC